MSGLISVLVVIGTLVILLIVIRLLWERWWREHFGKPKS